MEPLSRAHAVNGRHRRHLATNGSGDLTIGNSGAEDPVEEWEMIDPFGITVAPRQTGLVRSSGELIDIGQHAYAVFYRATDYDDLLAVHLYRSNGEVWLSCIRCSDNDPVFELAGIDIGKFKRGDWVRTNLIPRDPAAPPFAVVRGCKSEAEEGQ